MKAWQLFLLIWMSSKSCFDLPRVVLFAPFDLSIVWFLSATTTRSHDEMFSPVKDVATANTTSNTTKTTTSIGVSATTFKDTESKPNRVEDWLLQRQMQVHEFGSIIVAFSISGNTLRVGMLVIIASNLIAVSCSLNSKDM